jgi:6-phosphofructokinase 1
MIKKIGIITSGGDCGGINAVIKGAAQMTVFLGCEAYMLTNGYAGLYNLIEYDTILKLDAKRIDSIRPIMAGSEAGHSRVKISKINDPQKYQRIKNGLEKFSIDALIIAGGDDTGSVVVDLNKNGIPCIHVPKTMDLDLNTYSVGGDSSVNRIANYIEEIKTTGRTHNRIMILEVFGRYAGHTTFRGGVAGDADCILIPEIPVDFQVVYQHCRKTLMRRIRESDTHNGTYIIVVNEGLHDHAGVKRADETVAADAFGHKKLGGSGKFVREQLNKYLLADAEMKTFYKDMGLFIQDMNMLPEIRESVPKYLIRSGYSSALDINFGKDLGAGAVILLQDGIIGVTVTGVREGRVQYMDTQKAIEQRFVDMNMVSFYECMGICFGRNPGKYKIGSEGVTDEAWKYL